MGRSRLIAGIALSLVACGKKQAADSAAPPMKPAAAAPTPTAPAPAAPAAPAPAAPALVETSLASQGAAWAGWTIQAPPDTKLEPYDEPVKGAVGARWGNGAGMVVVKRGTVDFGVFKRDNDPAHWVVTKTTPDLMEATFTIVGHPLQCFYMKLKLGTADATCWTGSCAGDDAGLALARSVCTSLAKK